MNERDFNDLVESIQEAGKIKAGKLPPSRRFEFSPLDIKAIREKLCKSQADFARMIGVSVSTLQNWEQGRRKPEGPAKALLQVASKNPKAVFDQVPLGDEVQLEVQEKQVVIRPAVTPRQGWEEQFRLMAEHGDDRLLDADLGPLSTWDKEEWQW